MVKHWVCLPCDLLPIHQLKLKDPEDLGKGGAKERRSLSRGMTGEKLPDREPDVDCDINKKETLKSLSIPGYAL